MDEQPQQYQRKMTVNSILQISVMSFEEKFINNKSETFYTITINNLYNNTKWKIEKTYKDVETLNTALLRLFPHVPSFGKANSLFKSSKSYNTILERQNEIYEFLNECVERKDILSNLNFYSFIELDKNFPELVYNVPELVTTIKDSPITIIDFEYLYKENIIFCLLSDIDISSRMDSYMKSGDFLKFKKEDSSAKTLSENEFNNEDAKKNKVGGFCVYKLITYKNKKNELKVKLNGIFAKYFNEIASSFCYENKSNYFVIGFITGKILFYKISPDSEFSQFDFITEINYHYNNVTGIALNSETGKFYSCGEDGKFYTGIIKMIHHNEYYPQLINESSHSYTKLYYEKENERIYLSTSNGHLEVYLTSNLTPTFIKDVITTNNNKCSLNDLTPYNMKHYLFSCSDIGNISVFDLGKHGQEKTTKELSYFNYYEKKFKIKTIIYDSDLNQVITGDEQGRVIFWSLKYGKPIHVTRVSSSKSCILKMRFVENSEESNKLLFISCANKTIYFLKLPLKWVNNEDIEKYEKIEIKNRSDLDAMIKIQDLLEQNEDYNSDEDSLNGWDYFANDAVEEREKNKNKK